MNIIKNTEVNIVGKGPGWQSAPMKNAWSFNDHILKRPFDIIFDMHGMDVLSKRFKEDDLDSQSRMYECARQADTIMYSLEAWRGTPYVRYPIEEIMEEFKTDYFTSGFDYAIALAIYKGFENVSLWGFSWTDEYSYQTPSVMFWLGIARGRGMTFKIKDHWSKLFNHPTGRMYGYLTKIKEQEFAT